MKIERNKYKPTYSKWIGYTILYIDPFSETPKKIDTKLRFAKSPDIVFIELTQTGKIAKERGDIKVISEKEELDPDKTYVKCRLDVSGLVVPQRLNKKFYYHRRSSYVADGIYDPDALII